jgi:CubicO group peptidase (beta-lactamase class C family)
MELCKRITVLLGLWILANVTSVYAHTYHNYVSLPKLFKQAIHEDAFPGACIAAGTKDKIAVMQCFGYQTYQKAVPVQLNSIFDLASLTKVVATMPAIMKLYDQGKIHLDDKVVKYLPQFRGPTWQQTRLKSHITIRELLAHSSGLPADEDVDYLPTHSVWLRWQKTYQTPVIEPVNTETIYSDVNFEILGKIVEKVSHMPLDQFTKKYIFAPLGMKNTFFNPPASDLARILPTGRHYNGSEIRGRVQDEIAASLGGVSGHAGLFSTIGDLSKFAQMILNKGSYQGVQIFRPSTVMLFARPANLVPGSSRALGWDTAYNTQKIFLTRLWKSSAAIKLSEHPLKNFTAGRYIDAGAIGHSGYTGTSMWISFKNDVFVILLTNHLFPYKGNFVSNSARFWRQRINSAVWQNFGFTKKNLLYQEPHR